jgi:hypothetical protein
LLMVMPPDYLFEGTIRTFSFAAAQHNSYGTINQGCTFAGISHSPLRTYPVI